jgi:hypothetical protein
MIKGGKRCLWESSHANSLEICFPGKSLNVGIIKVAICSELVGGDRIVRAGYARIKEMS